MAILGATGKNAVRDRAFSSEAFRRGLCRSCEVGRVGIGIKVLGTMPDPWVWNVLWRYRGTGFRAGRAMMMRKRDTMDVLLLLLLCYILTQLNESLLKRRPWAEDDEFSTF